MAERLKAHAWKACKGLRPSGVRIPLSPLELRESGEKNVLGARSWGIRSLVEHFYEPAK